jgi:hypothetical protein
MQNGDEEIKMSKGCGKPISIYHNEYYICGKKYDGEQVLCEDCLFKLNIKLLTNKILLSISKADLYRMKGGHVETSKTVEYVSNMIYEFIQENKL